MKNRSLIARTGFAFAGWRTAFQRERSLKRWPRQWKINLIERENPLWEDLYPTLR